MYYILNHIIFCEAEADQWQCGKWLESDKHLVLMGILISMIPAPKHIHVCCVLTFGKNGWNWRKEFHVKSTCKIPSYQYKEKKNPSKSSIVLKGQGHGQSWGEHEMCLQNFATNWTVVFEICCSGPKCWKKDLRTNIGLTLPYQIHIHSLLSSIEDICSHSLKAAWHKTGMISLDNKWQLPK